MRKATFTVGCLYNYLVHVSMLQVGKGKRWEVGGGRWEGALQFFLFLRQLFMFEKRFFFKFINSPHLLLLKIATLNMTPLQGLYVSFRDYTANLGHIRTE